MRVYALRRAEWRDGEELVFLALGHQHCFAAGGNEFAQGSIREERLGGAVDDVGGRRAGGKECHLQEHGRTR